MMRSRILALLIVTGTTQVGAQIIRPRMGLSAPSTWLSASGGIANGFTVRDGTTGSTWEFGSGYPLGFAIERAVSPSIFAGIRGSNGLIPLNYTGSSGSTEADARVTQVLA